jgi:tagatose-1,6-bisphosphate aldolase
MGATEVDVLDPGKVRGLQRVTSSDGYFLICALDHLSDFQELIGAERSDYEQTVEVKLELVRELSPVVSAFLLDAHFGLAQAILSRSLPGHVGLMASVEDEGYERASGSRATRLRADWNVRKIKLIGADVCKLLWFYRPDAPTAEQQRQLVRELVEQCADLSLPLVVEPIWHPLEGEDATSAEWRARRVEGIIASAREASGMGVDMLKVEFPGDVDSPETRTAAQAACDRLEVGIDVPWVILSAGVGYDDFRTQVQIACKSGASGFLAGRSIWRDAAITRDESSRASAVQTALSRLSELADLTRRHGRPYRPALEGSSLLAAAPEHWYREWHV